MSDLAISVCDVRKKYRLFDSPMERLKEALHPFRKHYHREFWALNGVSVDVPKGQTIGILGRNGSGKSTLLQIIAGILQPTSGSVMVQGRVSALLELGAGFNPEFTGRENVMLNGAITGVPREEMVARMPEIEAFADIGEFFDQPVKTYSSGMFVRVAFAAAINVDPDILIVDEALAVGDGKFQQRCFSKFKEFQRLGVTIVFVTHDIESIVKHCQRAILLNAGQIVHDGHPTVTVRHYIDLMEGRVGSSLGVDQKRSLDAEPREHVLTNAQESVLQRFVSERVDEDGCARRRSYNPNEYHQTSQSAVIVDYLLMTDDQVDLTHIRSGEVLDIVIKVLFRHEVEQPCFGLSVKTQDGVTIYALNSFWTGSKLRGATSGEYRVVRFRTPMRISPGDVFLDFGVDETTTYNSYRNITRRMAVAHIVVLSTHTFHGIADLGAQFAEVALQNSTYVR